MSVKSLNAITGFSHRLVRYAVERHFESIFLLALTPTPAPSLHIFLFQRMSQSWRSQRRFSHPHRQWSHSSPVQNVPVEVTAPLVTLRSPPKNRSNSVLRCCLSWCVRLHFLPAVAMKLPLAVFPVSLRLSRLVLVKKQIFCMGRVAIFVG